MKLWQIEEECEYPGVAMAVAEIWTPARWKVSKTQGWITHAGEAMRSLFPNLPEVLEGPWGQLGRSEVFGADDACSSLLDAMEGLSLSEGCEVDKEFAKLSYSTSNEPLSERVESGKLILEGVVESAVSIQSQVAVIVMTLDKEFYKGEKAECLEKIDKAMARMGQELERWVPSLVKLADPVVVSRDVLDAAMANAKRCELDRLVKAGPRRPARRAL
jgi:hypothetical protein